MSIAFRDNLGEFSSVVCIKSIITGMEEALGEKATAIALIAAGRARGKQIISDLDLAGQSLSLVHHQQHHGIHLLPVYLRRYYFFCLFANA